MHSRGKLAVLAFVLILAPVSVSATGSAAHLLVDTEEWLVAEALMAAGIVDPIERFERQRDVWVALDRVVDEMGKGRPTYRRAARLHRMLHHDYLRQYREDADGLHDIVASGEFNCLSATLFYGLAARELGFDVVVLELPGHLLLGLEISGRRIEVETTTPRGFDRPRDVSGRSPDETTMFRGIPGLEPPEAGARSTDDGAGAYWEFSLESSLGFAWLNAAWHSLEMGNPVEAARCVVESSRFLGGLSTQEEGVRRLLSRAFRLEYESGRFDGAYRIAAIEADLFPATTTSRDRLLAAGVKRVEDMCDVDAPRQAAAVVKDVNRIVVSGSALTRFERRAWPIVTAAAVRLSDWRLAQSAAESYAGVEPDIVEARRVVDWVAHRRHEASASRVQPVCSEPDSSESSIVSH